MDLKTNNEGAVRDVSGCEANAKDLFLRFHRRCHRHRPIDASNCLHSLSFPDP